MPKFFMWLIKQKLKTYILLKIFLRVTTISRVTNSSGITTLKISFMSGLAISFYLDAGYWNSLVFVSLLVNTLNILTFSGSFLDCLQLESFDNKGIDIEST